jgi:hypothetical protein
MISVPHPKYPVLIPPYIVARFLYIVDRASRHKLFLITNPMHFFVVLIYSFHLSTCFEHQVLIIRRSNCISTSSGTISSLFPPDRHTNKSLTQTNHTKCLNTVRSPDDEHLMLGTCREMKWLNTYTKKCIRLVINKNRGTISSIRSRITSLPPPPPPAPSRIRPTNTSSIQ